MKHKNNAIIKLFLYLGCGVLIGGVNGFFGGGGGMICVPFLLLLGLDGKKAHATAILIMLPISIASAIIYYSNGFVDFGIVAYVAIGSVIGAILGALLLKKMPTRALAFIFPIIMIMAGVRMIF